MTKRSRWRLAALGVAVAALAAACTLPVPILSPAAQSQDDVVRLNHLQVIGSHNSYRRESPAAESAIRRSVVGDLENELEFGHVGLVEQFALQGVRQIELDVFRDDAGGKYANPLLRSVVGGGPHDPVMQQPGTKVLHIQDVDYHASCLTLVKCLQDVLRFSNKYPNHLPIAILLELKDSPLDLGSGIPTVVPDPWNAAALDALDQEILSVVPRDKIIAPDDVRGEHDRLDVAVTTDGWPTLAESRGKVLFLMDNEGGYRTSYLSGHPSLAGRVLFTNANPGQADAAFVKRNSPTGASQAQIAGLVAAGYVVRTRADTPTIHARTNDTSMRDAALASGAQWVSTDYPILGPTYAERFGTTYVAEIPGPGWARCNPINAPVGCDGSLLE